jgi:hypothetical protein
MVNDGCDIWVTPLPRGRCYDTIVGMGDLMDDLEDRAKAADDLKEKPGYDWDVTSEGRDDKPAVEPFDPYFGRRPSEKSFWL